MEEVFAHARERALEECNALPWYQKNLDISVPLLTIGIGLFQFVLRKWILPVPLEIIEELEDRFATQGIGYHPGLGAFLMIIGAIMLVLFNLEEIFSLIGW